MAPIRETAVRHGELAGLAVASGEAAALAADDGFHFVSIGDDSSFLQEAARSALGIATERLRGAAQ